jgi:23S rRNA (uracil747-C5)-methyltransferase
MPSFCSHFDRGHCRSCSLISQSYSSQIAAKEHRLRGLAPDAEVESSVLSPLRGFRSRAKMIVTGSSESPVIGLYGEDSLDQGRELLDCPIHHPRLNELIAALPKYISKFNLTPYRVSERKGELKALIAFFAPGSSQFYLRFVLRSKECVARLKKMLPELTSEFLELCCVTANIQPIAHAVLEGPEEIFITEARTIDLPVGGVSMRLAPQAFVQTNQAVAEELYLTASRWVSEAKPHAMVELFCGQGAFSLISARSAARILGIEINPDAVHAANETARTLGLSHVEFRNIDARSISAELKDLSPHLILANPPRKGLGESLKLILEARPQHVLYSSCSIESLSQDLKHFQSFYRVRRVRLFDMFPHTEHFESLLWLDLREPAG